MSNKSLALRAVRFLEHFSHHTTQLVLKLLQTKSMGTMGYDLLYARTQTLAPLLWYRLLLTGIAGSYYLSVYRSTCFSHTILCA